jgi:hypothetical protein
MEVSTGLTCFSRIMLRLWELLFSIYLPCLNNTIQILVEFTHNNAIISMIRLKQVKPVLTSIGQSEESSTICLNGRTV